MCQREYERMCTTATEVKSYVVNNDIVNIDYLVRT